MKSNSINVGSASFILIFMVMCLSCVSLLSLSIVEKDLKKSDRIGGKIQNYYYADTEANRYLEKVYMTLNDALKMDTNNIEDYLAEELGEDWDPEIKEVAKRIALSDYQDLAVRFKLDWSEGDASVEVLEWYVCNKEDIEINQDMNVFIFD